jgi:hypothetical protein
MQLAIAIGSLIVGILQLLVAVLGLLGSREGRRARSTEGRRVRKRALTFRKAAPFLPFLFAGGVIFTAGGVWALPGPEPEGRIVTPASGERVGRDIEARGVLADIPEDQHVWLAVRDGNLLYPQASEVTPPDGEWSLSFHQGGETKVISLELYLMGDDGNRFLTDRFKARDFSGISRIPGAVRLDAVENLRIRG